MSASVYLIVSGCIFGIVAILHLLRVINEWALVLGPWAAPMWASWVGIVIPLVLTITAFRLVFAKSE